MFPSEGLYFKKSNCPSVNLKSSKATKPTGFRLANMSCITWRYHYSFLNYITHNIASRDLISPFQKWAAEVGPGFPKSISYFILIRFGGESSIFIKQLLLLIWISKKKCEAGNKYLENLPRIVILKNCFANQLIQLMICCSLKGNL